MNIGLRFGTRRDVFDYERVQWTLQPSGSPSRRQELKEADPPPKGSDRLAERLLPTLIATVPLFCSTHYHVLLGIAPHKRRRVYASVEKIDQCWVTFAGNPHFFVSRHLSEMPTIQELRCCAVDLA
jgi:hypothetical protein